MSLEITSESPDQYKRNTSNFDSTLRYDTDFGYSKMSSICNKMIKNSNITLNDNILEIGGGTGELILKYANYTRNIVVTDINPYMIKVIQQKARDNKNIFYALTDAKKIPFKDNSFNVVLERNLPLIYLDTFISDGTAIKVLNEMKRVSNDKVVVIHQNNTPLQRKEAGVHLFNESELKTILEDDLELVNVKVINAVFSNPFLYSFLEEALSREIEKICGDSFLLKRFSGCLIACGSKMG
ncbi:class I SAM-dependent methyltransferase [Methanoculleus sp. UBA303]|uniref:class I SAM-dependent methyltransferase n=1 Tax=Methanoculleus sp. UBA303 TaxID=1915497 RepID=UPI0025FF8FDC|nr:methyltransferase domain-containing protein [Methanoculleus sp. UBA303]